MNITFFSVSVIKNKVIQIDKFGIYVNCEVCIQVLCACCTTFNFALFKFSEKKTEIYWSLCQNATQPSREKKINIFCLFIMSIIENKTGISQQNIDSNTSISNFLMNLFQSGNVC